MHNPTVTVHQLAQLGVLAYRLAVVARPLGAVSLMLERQAARARREAAELLADLAAADEPMSEAELEAMRAGMDAEWRAMSQAEREQLHDDEPLSEPELEAMRAVAAEVEAARLADELALEPWLSANELAAWSELVKGGAA